MRLCVLLVLVLLVFPATLAFSVSPAKQTIVVPAQETLALSLAGEGEFSLRVEGQYAEHFSFPASARQGRVLVRINIPEGATIPPGDHPHLVIFSAQEGGIAKVELASLVTLRRLASGPYLRASVHASPISAERTIVYATLENLGNESVIPERVRVVWGAGEAEIAPVLVPAGGAASMQAEVAGRGRYDAALEADALTEEFELVIGEPRIASFSARAIPESGPIAPIEVRAQIDWNSPVEAVVAVGSESYSLMVDGVLEETFYTEERGEVNVSLAVGGDARKERLLIESPGPRRTSVVWWLLLVLLLIVPFIAWDLFRQLRRKG